MLDVSAAKIASAIPPTMPAETTRRQELLSPSQRSRDGCDRRRPTVGYSLRSISDSVMRVSASYASVM